MAQVVTILEISTSSWGKTELSNPCRQFACVDRERYTEISLLTGSNHVLQLSITEAYVNISWFARDDRHVLCKYLGVNAGQMP